MERLFPTNITFGPDWSLLQVKRFARVASALQSIDTKRSFHGKADREGEASDPKSVHANPATHHLGGCFEAYRLATMNVSE
jgi:hypothetical protein